MNKGDLVASLAKSAKISKSSAQCAVNCLFDTSKKGIIASELIAGHRVQITGFGTFETRKRKPRIARNPRTGEKIKVAGGNYPAFRAGSSLKQKVRK